MGPFSIPAASRARSIPGSSNTNGKTPTISTGSGILPAPGALRPATGPIAWLADNTAKGLNDGPGAVTLHADPDFSRDRLAGDLIAAGSELLESAAPWLGARVTTFQVHRWRYSQPRVLHGEPFLRLAGRTPVFLAGDAFGQPRVEGAALAGMAAAEALGHELA